MTKSAKNNPEPGSGPIWILLAGGVLALVAYWAWPVSPVPAPAASATPAASHDAPVRRSAFIPEPRPVIPPAPPPPVRYLPAAPLVRTDTGLQRGTEEIPWQLPSVGLPPDRTWELTPEQRAQFEKLARDFLAGTGDVAGGREQWARARAASDADFRAFFGDTVYFDQLHRVALHRDDIPVSSTQPISEQP